jgi:hypothetical protein
MRAFPICLATSAFVLTVGALADIAPSPAPPAGPVATNSAWSGSLSLTANFVSDDGDYFQSTVAADRGWLHLEARYNYEAQETASLWGGYNFAGGGKLTWAITPMLGVVFGGTHGVAPGYEGSLAWGKLELYSEGEYLFDTGDFDDSYFYSWSELTVAPWPWLRAGLATQRTRAYQSDREIQRGLLLGCAYRELALTTYWFNPDEATTLMITLDWNF